MENMSPGDVERWILGLGSLLPSEAVRALIDEVRNKRLDGLLFDQLVSNRGSFPILGGAVRPSHMATLRRCWQSKVRGSRMSRSGSFARQSTRGSIDGHTNAAGLSTAVSDGQPMKPAMVRSKTADGRLSRMSLAEARAHQQAVALAAAKRRTLENVNSLDLTYAPPSRGGTLGKQGSTTPSEGINSLSTAVTVKGNYGRSSDTVEATPPSTETLTPKRLSSEATTVPPDPSRRSSSSASLQPRPTPSVEPPKPTTAGRIGHQTAAGGQPPKPSAVGRGSHAELGKPLPVEPVRPDASEALKQKPAEARTPSRTSVTRRRSASEMDSEIPPPLRPVPKCRRPPQVPPLDLSFIHGGAAKKDGKAPGEERPPGVQPQSSQPSQQPSVVPSSSLTSTPADLPAGFAAACPEDQARIAAFYGYRSDGFKATMHGLRTDEIRPRLYLGTMADAAYWPMLKALGVSHVLNCAVEAQKTKPPYEAHGIKYMLMPLQDSTEQANVLSKQHFRALREATKFISACSKAGQHRNGVFVHCVQGLARSAAIVCAYLMEYEGLPMEKALAEVRQRHKGCLTSHHWQGMLYRFGLDLLSRS